MNGRVISRKPSLFIRGPNNRDYERRRIIRRPCPRFSFRCPNVHFTSDSRVARFFGNYRRWSAPPPPTVVSSSFASMGGWVSRQGDSSVMWWDVRVRLLDTKDRPSSSSFILPPFFLLFFAPSSRLSSSCYCCRLFVSMARTAGRTGSSLFLLLLPCLVVSSCLFSFSFYSAEKAGQTPTRDSLWLPQRTERNYPRVAATRMCPLLYNTAAQTQWANDRWRLRFSYLVSGREIESSGRQQQQGSKKGKTSFCGWKEMTADHPCMGSQGLIVPVDGRVGVSLSDFRVFGFVLGPWACYCACYRDGRTESRSKTREPLNYCRLSLTRRSSVKWKSLTVDRRVEYA